MTIGVTADSSTPGTRIVSAATSSSTPGAVSPAPRTTNGVTATTPPETASSGARTPRGSTRSAYLPPSQEPAAIAVSAMPMTIVLVSRVRPR